MKEIWQFLQKENFIRLFAILIVLVFISATGLAYFESNIAFKDALWWSIVTLTTVGYGDISPTTIGGRVIGIIIMFLGIGILGMFTATIASIFVEKKMKEERGMNSFDFEDHIILCEWNNRARQILAELRTDSRYADRPIVLIADIDIKPVDDDRLFFIQGEVNEENLSKANLVKASTVVILGDDRLDENARDAKAILITLTVETINPDAYSIVELVDEANARHCERANADEIIVGAEFRSKLISRAALDHGISKVISELLSSRVGNDLCMLPVPAHLAGRKFIDVFTAMKSENQSIVLAVQHPSSGQVLSNPPVDYPVQATDRLIAIASTKETAK